MTSKVRLILLLILGLNVFDIAAQNYYLDSSTDGTTINTCGGSFFDSGGNSNYSNDESYDVTFCSTSGQQIEFDFTYFSVENNSTCAYDEFLIYDGPNSSSTLIGTFCGTNSPNTVTSSGSCLHFVFNSDYSVTAGGWEASITCSTLDEICGNGLDDNNDGATDEFCSLCATGGISYDRWLNISGSNLSNLTGSSNYPNNPSESGNFTLYQGPNSYGDNYGTRVQGFLKPEITGLYRFTITADDNAEFYLSTNGDPNNKVLLASIPGWTQVNEFDKYPEQVSVELYLFAGAHYYTEFLHKEGGGGDHFQVFWTTPNNSTRTIIPGSVLSPLECCSITVSPDVTICPGSSTVITTTPTGDGSYTYSWTPSSGLSSSTIQNPTATPNSTTNYVVQVTDATGCTSTDEILVTVTEEIIISLDDETICFGESSNVTPTSTGAGPFTYDWGSEATSGNTLTVSPIVTTTYVVTVTDNNNCTNTASTQIIVEPLPNVTLNLPISEFCLDDSNQNLSGGLPTGGSYSGTGVTESVFSISVAGAGTHEITYSFTDSNGCTNSASQTIDVHNLPTVSLNLTQDEVCKTESSLILAGGSPSGGTYAGDHVSGNTFDVTAAGVGFHTVNYNYTDANGCSNVASQSVEVLEIPHVTLNLTETSHCIDESSYTLQGGLPSGGTYSGTAVTNGVFDASLAGIGVHTITYSYTDSNGCTNHTTEDIEVYALPTVDFTLVETQTCLSETNFNLTGGTPAGGSYGGLGVSGTSFDASIAGLGNHTITYTYTDSNGCSNSSTQSILVNDLPVLTLDIPVTEFCIDDVDITLQGENPSGGSFSGLGVSGNIFSPSTAGDGEHEISYTFTDSNGCTNIVIDTIEVFTLPTVTLDFSNPNECYQNSVYLLDEGTPIGGTYSGVGVTGNNFDANEAGIGTHVITYTYTDANGCTNQDTDEIEVQNSTITNLNLPFGDLCEEITSVTLSGGNPGGGTYSGLGVTGNTFNPNAAGVGSHTITYTFDDGYCINVSTDQIIVIPTPEVTFSLATTEICFGESIAELSGGLPVGGTYSGIGVADGSFDSFESGAGTFEITYSYTAANGCTGMATQNILVHDFPFVELDIPDTITCVIETTHLLEGGLPSGGSFSGPGVIGDNFDASIAGVGNHEISYLYTDPNGCVGEANDIITVLDIPSPSLDLSVNELCEDQSITLSGESPEGGIWEGPGVTGNEFNASDAGPGTHTINYYFELSECTSLISDVITVYALPEVSIASTGAQLCYGESLSLPSATPIGGVWSGEGVIGDEFDSTFSGEGIFELTYTYTDSNGCMNSATYEVEVFSESVVGLELAIEEICEDADSFELTGGTPSGGTYSGTGVVGNNFDPSVAGVGIHIITYDLVDENGCPQSAVDQLEVIALPNASLELVNSEVCPGMGIQTLAGGWPLGGTYSGSAVTGNQFDPDVAGSGIHTITYTVTVNGCTSSATDEFEVFDVNSIELELTETETCIGDDIILDSNAPAGGNYSGVGVNPWNGTFSTVVAGVGTHIISYDYIDENDCLVELFDEITVYDVLPATLSLETNLACATESNIPLSGGSPAGGTWSGPGVSGNTFDPLSVGAGVYTITYTYEDSNGCSAIAIDEIVVESAPIVTYTYEDDHCNLSNGSITFQFQDQNDVSFIEFSLNDGINWMSPVGDNLSSITYANLSSGIYELLVRNSNGTCEIDLGTIEINNIDGPDADAGPDVTIAASTSTQLTGTGGNFYSWTPSTGLNNTNIANPIASPTVTTTYILEVTDIFGCTDTDQVTITVDVPCAGTVTEGDFPYLESFESGLGIWSQDQTDDFDWIRDNGNPAGPASGSQGSWYMLAEGSGNSDQTGIFRSPCFDLENESCAQFTFNYYIANSGSLTLEASSDFGDNWLEIWNVSGNQGTSWNTQVVDLFGYLNSNLQLRFVADMGSESSGSIGIDNVEFITTGCGCADTSSPFIDFSLVPDPQPFSVDIDCDGDADVLSGGDGQLFFFENNGDGTYTDQTGTGQDIMPGLSFLDMTIGLVDLDNDGDKDMSIVGNEAFNKYFFWNTGSKTNPVFTEAGTGGTPANPIANFNFNPLDGGYYIGYADPTIFWADLDNDNDYDAVVGGKLGWFQYYENIGDENAPNLVLRTGSANPFDGLRVDGADEGNGLVQYESSPFLVDWDGDGDLDMFSGNQISTVQYFENVGSPSNPNFVERTGSANPFDGVIFSEDSHLSIVDEDCDGDWDVFYGVGDTVEDAEITMCDLLVAVPNFAQAGSDQSHYCIGDPIFLSELSHVGVSWSWTGPNGFTSTEQNPIIPSGSMENEGVYTVTITNEQGCISTSTIEITLSETIANAGPDSTIDLGEVTQNSGAGNGSTIYWTPATGLSNPNVLNPIATPSATTTYTLTVIDQFGCVATDQMTIYVVGTECSYDDAIFHSDFETTTGDNYWTITNNASDGNFVIGEPSPYIQSGVTVMEINPQEGDQSMITGNATNYTQDLDGGPSIARSINIELPNNANSISLNLFWYLSHYVNGSSEDYLTIEIRDASNNNVLEILVDENGAASDRDAEWTLANADLSAHAGKTIYIYVTAADIGNGSKLEVGIDNISISGTFLTVADIVLTDNDVCELDSPITLSGGTPAGGIYSGPGVTGNIFDPSEAGPGVHTISYEYEEINGCIAVAVEDIEVYQSPLAEIDLSVGEACINQPVVGLFGGTPTGGVWSGEGVIGSSFYPPEAGVGVHTITYTVSDENGCEFSVTDEFIVYAVPIVSDISKVDAYCDLDNGSITITFDDVTDIDSIQFSINGGFGWETAIPDTDGQITYNDLPSGTYDIWVQDAAGNCPYQLDLVFIENELGPIVDLGPDINKCLLESASINPIVEFGLAPYTYAWTGPNDYSSEQLSVDLVEEGRYVLLVTDNNNCTATDTIEINNFSLSVDANIVPIACFGDSNGRILASANGTSPFKYTLIGFNTNGSGVFNNLAQGNYQLEVEDAYGCVITQGFNVPGPPPFVCSQDSCVRSLSASWAGTANGPFTSTAGTSTISLNIVNDENTDVSNFNINEFLTTTNPDWFVESAEGTASLRLQAVWDMDSEHPTSDIDGVDDKETITFTFNFDEPVDDIVLHIDELGDYGTEGTTTWSNSSEWTLVDAGLSLRKLSGTNDLQVKTKSFYRSADVVHDMQDDAEQASGEGSAAGSIAITSASPITSFTFQVTGIGVEGLGYDELELAISTTVCYDSEPTDYHCDGTPGTATISALGGVYPHSYEWDNGETTQTAIDLEAGVHTVTITDANDCIIECSVSIEDSSIEIDAGPNQSFCTGDSGVLTPAVIEGLAPFQYAWSGPNSFDSTEANPVVNNGGVYMLTVTDANGCTDDDVVRVFEYVCNQTSNCYYLHEFNNFSYYGSDGTLSWSSFGWDESGDNNSAISGDVSIVSGSLSMQHSDSTLPSIKRQLDLSGHMSGVLSFDFLSTASLNGDDQFQVEIFDGSSWTTIFNYIGAGQQTPWLDISDYLSSNTEIRFSILSGFSDPGEELLLDNVRVDLDCLCEDNSDAGIDLEICEGDSIQLVGAGVGSYNWEPVAFLSDPTIPNPIAFPDQTTTFTLTVTDEFGCENTSQMTLTVNENVVAEAIPLSADYCYDGSGSATVIISQGVGPFNISYQSQGSDEPSFMVLDDIGNVVIDGLNGNTIYCIQVTDSNGCIIDVP